MSEHELQARNIELNRLRIANVELSMWNGMSYHDSEHRLQVRGDMILCRAVMNRCGDLFEDVDFRNYSP